MEGAQRAAGGRREADVPQHAVQEGVPQAALVSKSHTAGMSHDNAASCIRVHHMRQEAAGTLLG